VNAEGAPVSSYGWVDAAGFYLQPVPDGVWENMVTLRSTRWARMYAPGEFASRVSPTPLLMVVADRDTTSLTDLALATYERALEPKRLVMIEGGHLIPTTMHSRRSRARRSTGSTPTSDEARSLVGLSGSGAPQLET
jgi:uncharacterized protein